MTTLMDRLPAKQHLGDGAYVQVGCYMGQYVLTTEDGVSVQNTVVLGPYEMSALRRFVEDTEDAYEDHQDETKRPAGDG